METKGKCMISKRHSKPTSKVDLLRHILNQRLRSVKKRIRGRGCDNIQRARRKKRGRLFYTLAITSTQAPATDLGYLLHKNPARVQQFGKIC